MASKLITPSMLYGPVLEELRSDHWLDMERTRRNAESTSLVIAGEDTFTLPETFVIAGADQYIASIPHPRTVPQRVLQNIMADRPHLSVPLGPKGLGITSQRLTTKVEQPLNAICEDRAAGFQWPRACALLTFEGFCASVTVLDPADWRKRMPSQWENEDQKTWNRRYRVDSRGRSEDDDGYSGDVDDARARRRYELDLDVHRARNVPIRHRAIGIRQCAPIFDGDTDTVGGLIISQEFSVSYLKRKYRFGEEGLVTPTGANGQDGTGSRRANGRAGTLTLVEAWLYDEDGIPYVTYCVKGAHATETRWKGGDYDGELAVINLKERFGLDRLPVTWRFGLGNPGEINADLRAMGLIEPFAQSWRSVRAKLTAMNVSCMWMGFPVLIEESETPIAAGIDGEEPNNTPDLMPLKITEARPGTTLRALDVRPFSPAVLEAIQLELGAVADESPGKSNKDQSGFSQSLAAAFEELALSTVRNGLGELYEDHGSFVLEAGKRLPEQRRTPGHKGSGYAPIMVFASTDVPVNDSDDQPHRDPMELDPDLIDETFTVKAQYTKSMSIPERQQSIEEVGAGLKTRRKHLEDIGENAPEAVELELMLEAIRNTEPYQRYAMKLMAQVQGAEELEEIAKAQEEGLADEAGLGAGLNLGVAPEMPMGLQQPGLVPPPGVSGFGGPSSGQAALSGIVGGAGMQGPINNVVAAGGALPPGPLPTGGPV